MQIDYKDLSVFYPFTPFNGNADQLAVARAIKDIRIDICLAYNPCLQQVAATGNWLGIRLITLRKATGIVFLDFQFYDTKASVTHTIVWSGLSETCSCSTATVSSGSFVQVAVAQLEAILGSGTSIDLGTAMQLNPGCTIVNAKAPVISVYSMPVVTTEAVRATQSDSQAATGAVELTTLSFSAQGYNATISKSGSSIGLYFAAAAGLGRHTGYAHWTNLPSGYAPAAGLLSINGLYGDVCIEGRGAISAQTSYAGGNIAVTLSVNNT